MPIPGRDQSDPNENRLRRLATALAAMIGRASGWRNATTAPCNQELELRIREGHRSRRLPYPCLLDNGGQWLNVDLGTVIDVQPWQWRPWRRPRSPQPHHQVERLTAVPGADRRQGFDIRSTSPRRDG